MTSSKYYDLEFIPTIGCYYLSIFLEECGNDYISLYKIFLIFPLFYDTHFLKYLIKKRKTQDFSKIIANYNKEIKNKNFWLDYNTRYSNSKRYCYESLHFGIISKVFIISVYGIKLDRVLSKEIPIDIDFKIEALRKLGHMIKKIKIEDLVILMKIGEKK